MGCGLGVNAIDASSAMDRSYRVLLVVKKSSFAGWTQNPDATQVRGECFDHSPPLDNATVTHHLDSLAWF